MKQKQCYEKKNNKNLCSQLCEIWYYNVCIISYENLFYCLSSGWAL
jgi:hypothetical protein